MLKTLRNKSLEAICKVVTLKNAMVVAAYSTATSAFAAPPTSGSGGGATGAADKLGGTLTSILKLMPTVSKIAGVVVIIGGLWALYTHYKSAGREGSIGAGIAGIGVGVALFFLGGLLSFGADTLGIDPTTAMPLT